MSRKPLGQLLIEGGYTDYAAVESALAAQKAGDKRRIGELLVETGAVSEEAVARSLALAFNLRFFDPQAEDIDPELVGKLPRQIAERFGVLPVGRAEGRIRVAMSDPVNLGAADAVRSLLGGRVEVMVAPKSALDRALSRAYDLAPQAAALLDGADRGVVRSTRGEILSLDTDDMARRLRMGGQKSYVDLVSLLFVHAIQADASDIHMEPQQDALRVRFRVDGMLQVATTLPLWAGPPLASRIKVLAQLDVANRVRPQDGKFAMEIGGQRVDARVAVIPSQFGEKIVVRLLDPRMLQTDLGTLGMAPGALGAYFRMVSQPRGLVLCVGPTGSGKTTTLYSTITRLRSETSSIVTVEDPIEYTLDGVVQLQVNEKAGMNFPKSLRSILRQDANIVVVGEIRDGETALAAVQATSTGHLVLSSLHTSQTVSTLTRLFELGVPSYMLGEALNGVVAQRLLRRVCQACSRVGPAEQEEWERLGVPPVDLGDVHHVGPGCSQCNYTGYRGRIGVFEVLPISDDMRSMVLSNADEEALWRQARKESLRTLFDDALQKVADGFTTLQEVARVVPVEPWRQERLPSQVSGILTSSSSRIIKIETPVPDLSPDERSPLQVAVEAASSPPPAAPQSTPAPGDERPLVLIVDDADEILNLVALTLEDDYRVDTARDGVEALERVAAHRPDLLVLDVMMPRLSGYEVCERLKADPQTANIPVIMLSARGQRSHVKEGLRLGADDYLPKPFDPEELELRVRALIRRSRS